MQAVPLNPTARRSDVARRFYRRFSVPVRVTWLSIAMAAVCCSGTVAVDGFGLQRLHAADKAAHAAGSSQSIPVAGHSMHGEAFNEGPRQAAYLMGGTGKVSLQITTRIPEAALFFNQGVGQLHGFWYFEAERSFRQVNLLDPECAMAYWGMAMANTNNNDRAKKFIAKAHALKGSASPREQLWIEALHEYHWGDEKPAPAAIDPAEVTPPDVSGPVTPGTAEFLAADDESEEAMLQAAEDREKRKKKRSRDDKQKNRDYIRRLENILHVYPNELEAKAFLALALWEAGDNNSLQAVDALLDQVFAVEPMHPAHHFRIHLWDGTKPERALASAALCGPAAPSIAHMWHMPGHTYSHVERYAEGAWQQEASSRVDHARMIRDRILPDQIHNYAHNEEWLIRNLSYLGQVRKGLELAKMLVALPRHTRFNTPDGYGSASFGRTRLNELLVKWELWDEILACDAAGYLEAGTSREDRSTRMQLLAAARINRNEMSIAESLMTDVQKLYDEALAEQKKAIEKAQAKAREEKLDEEKTSEAVDNARSSRSAELRAVERQLQLIRGHFAAARSDYPEALRQYRLAKLQSKERLSQLQLLAGNRQRAEKLAAAGVADGVNEVLPLANQILILELTGKPTEAAAAFERLRPIAASADLDLPVLQRLKPIATRLGYPEDWRITPVQKADVGFRPSFDSLGPFSWQPTAAEPWSLPSTTGETVSLADYKGKSVLVIFYLGFGCVHCVEQLKAMSPMKDKFAAAGIDLVSISSDSIEALQTSLAAGNGETVLNFPLLSDSKLEIFRKYRTFDDFENQPLHGLFFIDPDGRVLWHDISHEPFTEGEFILKESQRLLKMYPATTPRSVPVPATTAAVTEQLSTEVAKPAAPSAAGG